MMINGIQRLLIFYVRGSRFALDLQDVAEVLVPPVSFPVPWAPGYLKGAINFHGNLVTLLDLADFMNVGPMEPGGNILVLDKRIANLALWVDGVENIVSFDAVLEEDESSDPAVDKLLIMADGEILMLAVGKLLERVEEDLSR
jgi:purine-binding chemotaxis protein CheW